MEHSKSPKLKSIINLSVQQNRNLASRWKRWDNQCENWWTNVRKFCLLSRVIYCWFWFLCSKIKLKYKCHINYINNLFVFSSNECQSSFWNLGYSTQNNKLPNYSTLHWQQRFRSDLPQRQIWSYRVQWSFHFHMLLRLVELQLVLDSGQTIKEMGRFYLEAWTKVSMQALLVVIDKVDWYKVEYFHGFSYAGEFHHVEIWRHVVKLFWKPS